MLREAVDIVNLFVDKNQKIVSQKGKVKDMNIDYFASKTAVDTEIPLAVLVDRGSASASEIVTGSIQELDRGCLLYTSDAADERSRVDLGGRRIIKKKKTQNIHVRG